MAPDAAALETRQRFWDLLIAETERRGLTFDVVPGGFAEKQQRAQTLARALHPGGPPTG